MSDNQATVQVRLGRVLLWVGSVLFALLFANSGVSKITGTMWAGRFDGWGYPIWFMYVTAGIEITAGLLLLRPRAAGPAAAALSLVMVGATATHVAHGEAWQSATIFGLLMATIAWTRLRGAGIGHAAAELLAPGFTAKRVKSSGGSPR